MWRKSVFAVGSLGTVFNDPRKISIEVELHKLGSVTLVSWYGWDSNFEQNVIDTALAIKSLVRLKKPFIIIGDINCDPISLSDALSPENPQVRIVHAGPTCVHNNGMSTLDYCLVSKALLHCEIASSSLSPLHLPHIGPLSSTSNAPKKTSLCLHCRVLLTRLYTLSKGPC